MEEEKNHNYETLLKEKKKIAEIMDIINETEDAYLINEMGEIINKKEDNIDDAKWSSIFNYNLFTVQSWSFAFNCHCESKIPMP